MNYLLSQLCLRASPGAKNYVLTAWSFSWVKQIEIFVIPSSIWRTFWRTCITFCLVWQQRAAIRLCSWALGLHCPGADDYWWLRDVFAKVAINPTCRLGILKPCGTVMATWSWLCGEPSGNLDLVDPSWLKWEMHTSKSWCQSKISRPEASWSLESKGAACVHNHIWIASFCIATNPMQWSTPYTIVHVNATCTFRF